MRGIEMKYFVLKPKGENPHAMASRRAMKTYATWIRPTDPKLADELEKWAREESTSING